MVKPKQSSNEVGKKKSQFKIALKVANIPKVQNTISPPKIVIASIILQQLIFLVTYGHHILNCYFLF